MRGKVFRHTHAQDRSRITPAYAGKRRMKALASYGTRDHPRLCGEKGKFFHSTQHSVGSPPPMRGKVFFFDSQHLRIGITPAYAGKSPFRHTTREICLGSPPPMRGKDLSGNVRKKLTRITPAYAGKSPAGQSKCRSTQDHPRLCGEKVLS